MPCDDDGLPLPSTATLTFRILRLQRAHHVDVGGVPACRQDDALARVDAEVRVRFLVARDSAGDTPVLVLLELLEKRAKTELGKSEGIDVVLENILDRGEVLGLVVVFLGAVARGKCPVALAVFGAEARLVLEMVLVGGLEHTLVPVDIRAGFFDPHLDQVVVDVAVRIANDLLEDGLVVDLELGMLGVVVLLHLAVHRADVFLHAVRLRLTIDDVDLRALFDRCRDCRHAARRVPNDQYLGVDGLGDEALVDLRRLAKPTGILGGVSRLGLHVVSCRVALGVDDLDGVRDSGAVQCAEHARGAQRSDTPQKGTAREAALLFLHTLSFQSIGWRS